MKGRKRSALIYFLVVLLFILIALVYTRPLAVKAGGHVLGDPGDTLLNIYIIEWTTRTLVSNPFNLFNATMFYPNPYTLAYSDHQFTNCLFAMPVLMLTRNPIFTFNFVLILVIVLSAVGGFLLVEHLTGDRLAGLAGGIIFGFPIYKLAHITHSNLLSTGFLPLSFLCLHLYTEKKKPSYAFLFAIFTIALFLTAWSYGFFLAFAVLVYLLVLLISKWRKVEALVRGRAGSNEQKVALRWMVFLLVSCVLTLLVLLPFVQPYLKVQKQDPNFRRDIRTVDQFSADIQDFLAAPTISLFWGRATARFRQKTLTRGGPAERSLFVGVLPFLTAVVGAIYLFKKRREKNNSFILGFYAILFVLAIIFCLGVNLNLNGHHINIFMPYRLLYRLFPGFKAIRTPTRMLVLALMSLSVLGGFCVKWIREGLSSRVGKRAAVAAVVVVLVLLTGEMMSTYIHNTELPQKNEFPSVYRWLETRKGEAPTAVLPLATYNPLTYKIGLTEEPSWLILEPWRIYYSTANWKKLLNGFSGYIPPSYYEAVKKTSSFPSDEALDFLRGLKIEYVVVEGPRYSRPVIKRTLEEARADPGFRLLRVFGDYYIFSLR